MTLGFFTAASYFITYVNYKLCGNNLKTGRIVEFKIPQPWPLQAAKGALLELKAKFGVPLSEGSGAQSSRAPLPTPGAFKSLRCAHSSNPHPFLLV
jgi:hypothetical protein